MTLSEYIILFVFVLILGAGLPGPGDASLIAAGTLAGEGKLNVWIVLAVSMTAWMLGSVIGYKIGERGGRALLDHPGRLENSRRKLLAKGDRAFARYNFVASVTMPAFASGISGCGSGYSYSERSSPVPAGSECTSGFRTS
jgi:membrane protein DedA with SNARE-associated domain